MGDNVKTKLTNDLQNASTSKTVVTKLIVQGLLMLLESDVSIECKQSDQSLVESCLNDAKAQYASVIKKESGADKKVNVSIDKVNYLPASCLGGVVLKCQGDKIKIDNTVDLRLKLVMEQDKPAIRKQLFGDEKAQPQSFVNGGSPKAPASNAKPAAAAPAAAPAVSAPAPAPAPAAAPAPAPVQASQGELKVGQSVMARYTDGTMNPGKINKVDKKKAKAFRVEWDEFPGPDHYTWCSQAEMVLR